MVLTGLVDPATAWTALVLNVCYVANYSDATRQAGGNPQTAIVNAETNNAPIAAVAMVNITVENLAFPFWANAPYVYFLVFAPGGPNIDDFVPKTAAALDSQGFKAVPGVCIACHGGNYDAGSHNVTSPAARFLPFDTPSLIYDAVNAQFSASAQSEAFRILNVMTRNADTDGQAPGPFNNYITSQTIRDLIAGWYSWCGGVDSAGCSIDDAGHAFIPTGNCANAETPATCGWTGSGIVPNILAEITYQLVPRAVCRTCHVAHSDVFNWQNFQQFQSSANAVCDAVRSYFMPFAQVPYNRFWGTTIDQALLVDLIASVGGNACQLTAKHLGGLLVCCLTPTGKARAQSRIQRGKSSYRGLEPLKREHAFVPPEVR
jgi:hypothetical protein